MGRAKIDMKYIQKGKPRKLSYNQRINGLKSKISEFSKSGAKACLIVYNDDDNFGAMTWPEDPTTVNSMLQEYEHQKIETPPKIFDVKDYFENKKDIAQAAIIKVRKDILKNKYPTWHPNFNQMEEKNLISFITSIEEKIQVCNGKISMLKDMQQNDTNFLQNTPHMQIMVQENVTIPQMQQQIYAPMKSIDDIQAENVTIPQMQQQIHAPMKSIDDITEMVVQENVFIPQMHAPMKSIDDISEMMVQENVTIPQMQQQIHAPMKSIDDISEMVVQENVFIPQMHAPMKSIDDISEMMVQENVTIHQMQQQIHPLVKSIDYINEMMNFTDLVDLPPISSTKQLGQFVECGNQVFNHDTQLVDPIDWTNYLDPDIFNWASNSDELSCKDISTR
ncbi:unnamed protein product [Trifolium pratense]|uniref:Uncharacterized protein n=1 Tax=Trifolium pratense TaxID=57577 RepID=A0ACB0L0P9_TRIPR|nr:unnamed protein product [Trifolium pratense]